MEYDINKDLLPLGTVVSIRFTKGKFVIMGYYPKDMKTGKIYDYALIKYPQGLIDLDDSIVVNRDLLRKVLHLGYESDVSKEFKESLEKSMNKSNSEPAPIEVIDF